MANGSIPMDSRKKMLITSTTDLNDCRNGSIVYCIRGSSTPINAPSASAYNAMIWNVDAVEAYLVQFYASYNEQSLYFRFKENNSWTAWKKVSTS